MKVLLIFYLRGPLVKPKQITKISMISAKWNAFWVGTQQRAFLVIYLPRPCEATTNICVRTSVWRALLRSQTRQGAMNQHPPYYWIITSLWWWADCPSGHCCESCQSSAKMFGGVISETVLTGDSLFKHLQRFFVYFGNCHYWWNCDKPGLLHF